MGNESSVQTHIDPYATVSGKETQVDLDYLTKIVLVGDVSADKSAFLIGTNDSDLMSIGVDFQFKTVEIDGKRIKLQIWDTAGQERFRTITRSYYRGAQGIMLVYDVTDEQTFYNIHDIWMKQIQQFAPTDVKKILIGHMIDKEDESYNAQNRVITYKTGKALADEYGIPFMEVRPKTGENVEEAFRCLAEYIYKQHWNSDYVIQAVKADDEYDDMLEAADAPLDKVLIGTEGSHKQKLLMFMNVMDTEHNISMQYLRSANWDIQKAMDDYLNVNNTQELDPNEDDVKKEKSEKKEEIVDKVGERVMIPQDIQGPCDDSPTEEDEEQSNGSMQMEACDEDDAEKEEKKMEPLKDDENFSGPVRQLKKFLTEVALEEYFESFTKNDCDIRDIEDFDDDILENDIGIKSRLKRKRFLREAGIFKKEMDEFNEVKIQHNVSSLISKQLRKHGIITVHILCNEVKCKLDLKTVLEISNDVQCDVLWNIIQSQLNPSNVNEHNNGDNDYPDEGVQNVANVETNTPYI
eukprot:139880_1